MARWHRQVVPKGRKYTKHTKRYTDKQRAAYWKKKYFDLRREVVKYGFGRP